MIFFLRELCPEWEIRSEKSADLAQDQFGICRSIVRMDLFSSFLWFGYRGHAQDQRSIIGAKTILASVYASQPERQETRCARRSGFIFSPPLANLSAG